MRSMYIGSVHAMERHAANVAESRKCFGHTEGRKDKKEDDKARHCLVDLGSVVYSPFLFVGALASRKGHFMYYRESYATDGVRKPRLLGYVPSYICCVPV